MSSGTMKILVVLLCCSAASALRSTRPTPADHLAVLSRTQLNSLMRLEEGPNFPAIDDQRHKCQILNTLYRYWRLNFRDSPEKVTVSERMSVLLRRCRSPEFRVADFFDQSVIFPGTKWCGQANVAENYHDLGSFNETDACCRDHDLCDDIIQSGHTKHNLANPYGTTRLHCKCDDSLRRCFRRVNSVVSNTVGYVFFSMLQTQCFDFDHPADGCELWKRGAVRLYCVKYRLREDQPKTWQWFDQEPYF